MRLEAFADALARAGVVIGLVRIRARLKLRPCPYAQKTGVTWDIAPDAVSWWVQDMRSADEERRERMRACNPKRPVVTVTFRGGLYRRGSPGHLFNSVLSTQCVPESEWNASTEAALCLQIRDGAIGLACEAGEQYDAICDALDALRPGTYPVYHLRTGEVLDTFTVPAD